jgi:hypothetical protein
VPGGVHRRAGGKYRRSLTLCCPRRLGADELYSVRLFSEVRMRAVHAVGVRSLRGLMVPLWGFALLSGGCKPSEYVVEPFEVRDEEPGSDIGSWMSMGIAPDGERLLVSYYDRSAGGLGFGIGSVDEATGEVSWIHEHVDGYPGDDGLDRGDRGKYTSMKVAKDGTVWVAYQDVTNGSLWAAHRRGPTWETMSVDLGSGLRPQVGAWNSLAIDENNNPVIAYYDVANGDLKVARLSDGTWTKDVVYAGEPWTGDEGGAAVTRPPAAGQYARLMIDGNIEYIAFYDGASRNLHLLEGPRGSYVHTVLTTEGDNGQWPSMVFQADTLHIAYQDVANQRLMLASRQGGAPFAHQTVDFAPYTGADTEVFIREGRVAITYFDGRDNDMKLATQSGAAWVTQRLAGEDGAAGYHNEVVRRGDVWWTATYDYTKRSLALKSLPPFTGG